MRKRTRSQPAGLHPYYDLEDALQRKYKRRWWMLGILILWLVGLGWMVYSRPTPYTSWPEVIMSVGLGGLLALVILLIMYLTTEHINFGDEREEQRLLKACLSLLQPYVDDPYTLESIATLAERRSTQVQLRSVVPGLLVTGFVALAVVDVPSDNIFGIVLLLTVCGTFFFLLELARAQAAGIIRDAIEIVRYEQHRQKQQGQTTTQHLLEALVLSNNGQKQGTQEQAHTWKRIIFLGRSRKK